MKKEKKPSAGSRLFPSVRRAPKTPPGWPSADVSRSGDGKSQVVEAWMNDDDGRWSSIDKYQGAPGVISFKPREWWVVGPEELYPNDPPKNGMKFPSFKSAIAACVLLYGNPT